MSIQFKVKSLDKHLFAHYFDMSPQELNAIGAYLFESDECPCYPCRVSLADAEVGETVLAINYEHLAALSPYKASGPIFIRKVAESASLDVNEIPQLLRHRLLSVRGYNKQSLMIEADTTTGDKIESVLVRQFQNESVRYIHIHNAGPGCFNCSVEREQLS